MKYITYDMTLINLKDKTWADVVLLFLLIVSVVTTIGILFVQNGVLKDEIDRLDKVIITNESKVNLIE